MGEIEKLFEATKPFRDEITKLSAEVDRLKKLIWTPHTKDFLKAVEIEAAHQRDRWGDAHDKMKTNVDWYWTLGWLSEKAVRHESQEKRLHHMVTSAALLLNWHRFASESTEGQTRGDS